MVNPEGLAMKRPGNGGKGRAFCTENQKAGRLASPVLLANLTMAFPLWIHLFRVPDFLAGRKPAGFGENVLQVFIEISDAV
jgi:hypothetical protein